MNDALSVDRGSLSTPTETQTRGTNGRFHVARITAGIVRGFGLRIRPDPIMDEPIPNLAHALVLGTRVNKDKNLAGGLTTKECETVARAARMVLIYQEPLPA